MNESFNDQITAIIPKELGAISALNKELHLC